MTMHWKSFRIYGSCMVNGPFCQECNNMSSYSYREAHYQDKTVVSPFYLYNRNQHVWEDRLYIETAPCFSFAWMKVLYLTKQNLQASFCDFSKMINYAVSVKVPGGMYGWSGRSFAANNPQHHYCAYIGLIAGKWPYDGPQYIWFINHYSSEWFHWHRWSNNRNIVQVIVILSCSMHVQSACS